MKVKRLHFIEAARKIIRDGHCENIECFVCPYYFEYKDFKCGITLGHFLDNPLKIEWFKKWLVKYEQKQLEFDF